MLEEYRVGRFSLSLPLTVLRAWQEHRLLSTVYFREVPWTASQGYKKTWSDWLRKLAERPLPSEAREVLVEQRELAPRCHAVLAHVSQDEGDQKIWFALLDAGTHGVWMECAQDPQVPEQALTRLETVVNAYRPLEARAPRGPEGWFSLERGVICLPPLGEEHVLVQFEDAPLDLRIELGSRPAAEAEPEDGLMHRLRRAMAMGLHGAREVTVLRSGARRVSGFEGEELILHIKEGSDERLTWGWWYPGVAGDPCAPCIELTMHSTARERDVKLRLWDETLESLRHLLPASRVDWVELR